MQNPIVTFETTKGVMKAELYPDIAPEHRAQFHLAGTE